MDQFALLIKFVKVKACLISMKALVVLVVEPMTSAKISPLDFEVLIIEIILISSPVSISTALISVVVSIRFLSPILVFLIASSPFSIVVKKTLETLTTLSKVLMMVLEVSLANQEQGEQSECNKKEGILKHCMVGYVLMKMMNLGDDG